MSLVDELLGIREEFEPRRAARAGRRPDHPSRGGSGAGPASDEGENALLEASVCPSCERTTEGSPCGHCGATLRFRPVGAVLGESDVLDELGLSEADLAESVDRPSGGGDARDGADRRLVAWAAALRDPNRLGGPLPAGRVAEILGGSGFAAGEVDASLRLVEARVAANREGAGRDDPPLSEGLDGWLDERVEG